LEDLPAEVSPPDRRAGAQAGGIPFEEKMAELTATPYEQFEESHRLEAEIKKNLGVLGFRG